MTCSAWGGPVAINLTSSDIYFPSMILNVNSQCRINPDLSIERNACAASRVVDPYVQIAEGTVDYEYRNRIRFMCTSGWNSMEGGAWEYQLRFELDGSIAKRCGQAYNNRLGTNGDPVTSTIKIFAWIRINDWTSVTPTNFTIPYALMIDYD